MRVVVFGATGYIGKACVEELVKRGHSVVAFTRPQSGIGGKQSLDDVKASYAKLGDVEVVTGDVTDEASITKALQSLARPADAAVCCLASRTGGRQDSFDIDYQATMNTYYAAKASKMNNYVLLSAVCVQRPLLGFQEAKLKAEKEIREGGNELTYSIVQPTAFFKSLVGQVKGVKGGSPYVMFGDGNSVRCKPISEEDLAGFIADCLWDEKKKNQTLPIGGPGPALSFREIGEEIYRILGKEPSFICVPYGVFDVVQGGLDFVAGLWPDKLSDVAEYGRIGRYYAEQSMLVLDQKTGRYAPELTPSYGKTSLPDFLKEALAEGSTKMDDQELGEQSVGSALGMGDP